MCPFLLVRKKLVLIFWPLDLLRCFLPPLFPVMRSRAFNLSLHVDRGGKHSSLPMTSFLACFSLFSFTFGDRVHTTLVSICLLSLSPPPVPCLRRYTEKHSSPLHLLTPLVFQFPQLTPPAASPLAWHPLSPDLVAGV